MIEKGRMSEGKYQIEQQTKQKNHSCGLSLSLSLSLFLLPYPNLLLIVIDELKEMNE